MQFADCLFQPVFIFVACEVLSVFPQLLAPAQWRLSEDGRLEYPELAKKYGYSAETKYVITEDGYNLTMFRIPGDRTRPMLLVHGNTASADCWIVRGNVSLAITLARRGFDVWAINLRGSRYSRRHATLDPDRDAGRFFNYSFYEQGVFDLPAAVDRVLADTGQRQLVSVSHSSGTTLHYVLGAERPQYNDKFKLAVMLAPVCYLKHVRGSTRTTYLVGDFLKGLLPILVGDEVYNYEKSQSLFKAMCLQPLGYELCVKGIIFETFGPSKDGFEPEFTNTFFGHWPCGASRKFSQHQAQVFSRDKFAKYDYGRSGNLREYGSEEPPEFELGRVTMPTALFYGRNDHFTGECDLARLTRSLPNVVLYQPLPDDDFSHCDFIWGRFMDRDLYPSVFSFLNDYLYFNETVNASLT